MSTCIDVRVWLFIFCLAMVFFQGRLPSLGKLDGVFFHVGLFFKTDPPHKADPVIITFPSEALDRLYTDPDHCEDLFDVLKKLKHASPAAVALMLDRPPLYAEDLTVSGIRDDIRSLEENAKPPVKPVLSRLLSTTEKAVVRGRTLAWHLDQADVILALKIHENNVTPAIVPGPFDENIALSVNRDPAGAYRDFLPESAYPTTMPGLMPRSGTVIWHGPSAPVPAYDPGSNWPLVWREGERYFPGLVCLMYAHSLKTKAVWNDTSGVVFGFAPVATDPRGFVKVRYGNGAGFKGQILRFTSDHIIKTANMSVMRKRPVFLGPEKDPSLTKAALAYLSLSSGALSHEPYQALWVTKFLIIGILVYLVVFVPLVRPLSALLVTLVLVCALLVVQMAYHLATDQFIPLAHALVLLVAGHGAMAARRAVGHRFSFLENSAQNALFELGRFQYDQSRLNMAFDTLKQCRPDDRILELLYKLAVSLERKRHFDKARDVFDHIIALKPSYRDCKDRSEQLSQYLFGRTQAETGPGTANLSRSVLGRYELEREIGRGAMGVVYLGQDPKIGRLIAIKTMDFTQTFEGRFDEVKDRFFREAMAAGRLNHPNIVTIYDAGEEQDLAYIAMDYVEGKPLNEFSRPENLLPVPVVFHIMAKVADALDYAHSQQIIHRDIKPGNIIYNPGNHTVKVTDFGIARIADTTNTRPGVVVGSPSFMAPEQLKGHEIDGRADIFSLGVTFYQLLTGTLPFRGEDLASLGYQITQGKHAQVTSVRKGLPKIADSIIDKALQKNPDKRYKSAAGMARSLRTVQDKGQL